MGEIGGWFRLGDVAALYLSTAEGKAAGPHWPSPRCQAVLLWLTQSARGRWDADWLAVPWSGLLSLWLQLDCILIRVVILVYTITSFSLIQAWLLQQHLEQGGMTVSIGVDIFVWLADGLVAKSCPALVIPWTVTCQAPLSLGFPRQEYWSWLPCPSPEDLPNPGIKSKPGASADKFFSTEPPDIANPREAEKVEKREEGSA